MKLCVAVLVGAMTLTGVAWAQTRASSASAPSESIGYAEGVAQASFGNVTSNSFGAEIGVNIRPDLQVFAEGGHMGDVATPAISAAAMQIAGYLSQSQSSPVGYSVKQPVNFGAAGLKYLPPIHGPFQPYVLGGLGAAKVTQNFNVTIGGTDVTSSLDQYGVTLGTDLSGSFTKLLLVLGGGVNYTVFQHLLIDAQYRYGRIFAEDQAINTHRAGIGVGVRF
jgi:opacity protein-like surface antigen